MADEYRINHVNRTFEQYSCSKVLLLFWAIIEIIIPLEGRWTNAGSGKSCCPLPRNKGAHET